MASLQLQVSLARITFLISRKATTQRYEIFLKKEPLKMLDNYFKTVAKLNNRGFYFVAAPRCQKLNPELTVVNEEFNF